MNRIKLSKTTPLGESITVHHCNLARYYVLRLSMTHTIKLYDYCPFLEMENKLSFSIFNQITSKSNEYTTNLLEWREGSKE